MRTFPLWIAVVAAAVIMAGCGARGAATAGAGSGAGSGSATAQAGHPDAPPNPSPSPAPTLTGPRQLTVADNGATVRLSRGQSVTAQLSAQGMFSWHVPTVTGSAVRQVDSGGGYPTDQPARATFLATQSGTATVTSTNDTACLHAHPACLPPQLQWRVTIVVG